MGLDGKYIAFDEDGQPWGVLDMNSGTVLPIEEGSFSFLEEPLRRDFAQYLVGERNLTASTAFTYEQSLRRIERFLGRAAHLVQIQEIRRFIREAPLNPSTKSGSLVALKALHQWALLDGLEWANGDIASVPGPKQIRNQKAALDPADAARLLDTCRRSNEFRVIALGLLGGLRVSESASIGEGEWLKDRLRFMGKGRKIREVPVVPQLAAVRGIILQRPGTSAQTLKHVCRSLAHVTEIPFTSHILRHTFGRTLRRAGVPREVIGALLGHAPLSVTETYAPVEWDEMVDGIHKVDYPTNSRILRSAVGD